MSSKPLLPSAKYHKSQFSSFFRLQEFSVSLNQVNSVDLIIICLVSLHRQGYLHLISEQGAQLTG